MIDIIELKTIIVTFAQYLCVDTDSAVHDLKLRFPQLVNTIEIIGSIIKKKKRFPQIDDEILIFDLSSHLEEKAQEILILLKNQLRKPAIKIANPKTILYDYFEVVEFDYDYKETLARYIEWHDLKLHSELYIEVLSWDSGVIASFSINLHSKQFRFFLPNISKDMADIVSENEIVYKIADYGEYIIINDIFNNHSYSIDTAPIMALGESYRNYYIYSGIQTYLIIGSSNSNNEYRTIVNLESNILKAKQKFSQTFIRSNSADDVFINFYQKDQKLIIESLTASKSLQFVVVTDLELTTFEDYVRFSLSNNILLIRENRNSIVIVSLITFEVIRYIIPPQGESFTEYHFNALRFLSDNFLINKLTYRIELVVNGIEVGANQELADDQEYLEQTHNLNSYLLCKFTPNSAFYKGDTCIIFDKNFQMVESGFEIKLPSNFKQDIFRILLKSKTSIKDINLRDRFSTKSHEINPNSDVRIIDYHLLLIENTVYERTPFKPIFTIDLSDNKKIKDIVYCNGLIAVTYTNGFTIDVWDLQSAKKIFVITSDDILKMLQPLNIPKTDLFWSVLGTTSDKIFALCSGCIIFIASEYLFK